MTDERPTPAEPETPRPEVHETVTRERVEVRRAPKFFNFMFLFAALAGIAVTIITFALPYDPETATYDRNTVFGFALLIAVAFGFALGAVIALIAERVTRRSARVVEVAHVTSTVKRPGE